MCDDSGEDARGPSEIGRVGYDPWSVAVRAIPGPKTGTQGTPFSCWVEKGLFGFVLSQPFAPKFQEAGSSTRSARSE